MPEDIYFSGWSPSAPTKLELVALLLRPPCWSPLSFVCARRNFKSLYRHFEFVHFFFLDIFAF